MRKPDSVEVWLILPLAIAAVSLTVGLAMFLSGTQRPGDVIQPVIVVLGGTLAAVLITFPLSQITEALRTALLRGIRGGTKPSDMIRAMSKVCDVSRRDGLLGVADIRSNSEAVEDACQLIGDAAREPAIRFKLERRVANERAFHQMTSDVFVFTAVYALLMGALASFIEFGAGASAAASASAAADAVTSSQVALPFVIGGSLVILLGVLLGRLRAAHLKELVVIEIAYSGASLLLEDNNVQRLRNRLALIVPPGLRR